MSTVNGQSVAVSGQRTERSMWAGPTLIFFFHVEHGPVACWLVACGACLWAGPTPIFYSRLRAGGILPALLFLVRNFLKRL